MVNINSSLTHRTCSPPFYSSCRQGSNGIRLREHILFLDKELTNPYMPATQFGFLSNLVKVFPSLRTRPLYLIGESYAGTYIPYLVKHYFGLTNPPVTLSTFAIGDGTLGSEAVFQHLPVVFILSLHRIRTSFLRRRNS